MNSGLALPNPQPRPPKASDAKASDAKADGPAVPSSTMAFDEDSLDAEESNDADSDVDADGDASMGKDSASTGSVPVSTSIPAPSSTPATQPSSAGASPAPSVMSKPPRPLACVQCQTRKIKCTKTIPCPNCIKAGLRCVPATPAPRTKRRRPHQVLQERLQRCEELLAKYIKLNPDLLKSSSDADTESLLSLANRTREWQPTGKLIKEGEDMRFIDSPVAAIIYEEVRAMRDIMSKDSGADSESECPEVPTVDDNSSLLIGGDNPAVNLASLWPERTHVTRLWQHYLERVNPLTKFIHVPTMQPLVEAASWGFGRVPRNVETLLFAVFLMTVVSLTPEECMTVLGRSREQALQAFSTGVRMSLLRINFLQSSDLTVLQALVLYLISLQGRYNRHAVWVLNGVAIRMAQKMGLHRDGTALGLSPFETEMRRRLWWNILLVDAKYAMFSGITRNIFPINCDTKPPTNINDCDFGPATSEPLVGQSGPTEMVFCLLVCKFAKFILAIPDLESVFILPAGGDPKKGLSPEQKQEYGRGLKAFREELISFFDEFCDKNAGGVHEITIAMGKHLVDKLDEFALSPGERPELKGEVNTVNDNLFMHAVSAFEHHEAGYEATKNTGFAWFTLLAFHIDLFLYVVGQLGQRLEGRLVERAWRQVGVVYTFHPELFDLSNRVYAALALHVLTAWSRRRQKLVELQGAGGPPIETPWYVSRLRTSLRETGFAWMDDDNQKTENGHAAMLDPPAPSNLFMQEPLLNMAGLGYGSGLDMLPDFGSSMAWDPFVPGADGTVAALQDLASFMDVATPSATAGNAPLAMNMQDGNMDWQEFQGYGSLGLGPSGSG